jgi:hypothetical protein
VSSQLHTPAALPLPEILSRYSLDRRLGRPQSRSGHCGEEKKKHFPCRKLNPGRPARSPSLYRLRYPDPHARLQDHFITEILDTLDGKYIYTYFNVNKCVDSDEFCQTLCKLLLSLLLFLTCCIPYPSRATYFLF